MGTNVVTFGTKMAPYPTNEGPQLAKLKRSMLTSGQTWEVAGEFAPKQAPKWSNFKRPGSIVHAFRRKSSKG